MKFQKPKRDEEERERAKKWREESAPGCMKSAKIVIAVCEINQFSR